MKPLEALHLQLRLEGREIVKGDLLRQVERVPGEDMPLMLLAQLADSQVVVYYDESLQPDLRQALRERTGCIRFPDIDPLFGLIQERNISFEVGHYTTRFFPEGFVFENHSDVICFPSRHPWVEQFGFGSFAEQVFGIERDGKIVSACVSVRENGHCGEAWVYTDPGYRKRGFARQVVSAWAQTTIQAGRLPFYSHKIENLLSAGLANSLGLKPVFEEISISYMNV